jgi:hypothetical protein
VQQMPRSQHSLQTNKAAISMENRQCWRAHAANNKSKSCSKNKKGCDKEYSTAR